MPRLGVVQMRSSDNKDANFDIVAPLVQRAAEDGVEFLSLPECFAFIGARPGASREAGESLEGPTMARYLDLAKEHRIWLSLGGFHESGAPGGRVYNTHVIVDSAGCIRSVYRKTHLFDVDTPDGTFHESDTTAPGDKLCICPGTPIGTVGVTICYDLRFPEVYTALRNAGADVILVPSAFMVSTGRAHWETLLRARAIETQCYVAAAAQCGRHSAARASYGHALIVDPWGTVVADAGGGCAEDGPTAEGSEARGAIVASNVETSEITRVRSKMPIARHRREDLYHGEVEGARPCDRQGR